MRIYLHLFLVFALALPLPVFPQKAQPPKEDGMVTFKSTSNLVIVNCFVRDRKGDPVEGLKKEDFKLLEDGKPQTISVFEYQRLEDPKPEPAKPALLAGIPRIDEPARPAVKTPAVIMPSRPGELRYRDRRLIVFFFDLSSMPPQDQTRAQNAALKFLREQMTASDVVSILTFSNELKVIQDFTGDKDLLTKDIRSFSIGQGSELSGEADTADTDTGQDTQQAFIADETEFNIFNTDRKLSALESAAKMLGSLPERKALVYFSSGVGKTGVENESQLRSTVNAAVRANVAFYPIDARGLAALLPGGDASQANTRGKGVFNGGEQTHEKDRFVSQQETLSTLAQDTGGKALLDNNDLEMGITQAQQDIRSYYIIGYYSSNGALDGRYRKVSLTLAATTMRAGFKLDYRSGYFSAKDFSKFNGEDKERQLEEALMLGDPLTDLPLALEVDYFRLTPDKYFIPISVKIPGSEITVAKKGSNEIAELDFIGQIRDAKGAIASNVRDGIKVKLTQENVGQLSKKNLEYDTGFTLAPGKYSLKFLARENRTGKMGTFETQFTIPDLTAAQPSLPISSVVWSNQREPLNAAVGSASTQKKLLAIHPLIMDGQKLVPSITRVFKRDQNLYVYFEVYDPATDPAKGGASLAATLSFYRGKAKVSESQPVRVTETPKARPHMAPFEFQASLAKLNPGRYICQVNIVDEVGRKFAFARAPVVILP
jgi:VWFA-related protein